MIGMGFAILGFYVIAEWQILGGLLIVFSGYGIIIATTKIAKKACQFTFLKLKDIKIIKRVEIKKRQVFRFIFQVKPFVLDRAY